MTNSQMKRVVVVSDFHCGHKVGLTHPDFDARPKRTRTQAWDFFRLRRKCWDFVARRAEKLQPVDLLIVNGDCIDGKGGKSGGTELLTTDRDEQCAMAVAVIEQFRAETILMSHGTPYHTGSGEDWENSIAKDVDAHKIGNHDFASVNGVVFDYRHYVGRSVIPHGRHTAVAREKLWSILWSERGEYPASDIILRSHVHYHAFCGGPGWLAMTTPALQAYGSKFGARIATGVVDYGFVHFDVGGEGDWSWDSHILRFRNPKRQVIKI